MWIPPPPQPLTRIITIWLFCFQSPARSSLLPLVLFHFRYRSARSTRIACLWWRCWRRWWFCSFLDGRHIFHRDARRGHVDRRSHRLNSSPVIKTSFSLSLLSSPCSLLQRRWTSWRRWRRRTWLWKKAAPSCSSTRSTPPHSRGTWTPSAVCRTPSSPWAWPSPQPTSAHPLLQLTWRGKTHTHTHTHTNTHKNTHKNMHRRTHKSHAHVCRMKNHKEHKDKCRQVKATCGVLMQSAHLTQAHFFLLWVWLQMFKSTINQAFLRSYFVGGGWNSPCTFYPSIIPHLWRHLGSCRQWHCLQSVQKELFSVIITTKQPDTSPFCAINHTMGMG